MLVIAVLGCLLAADAHVTDSINSYYFRVHYPGSTILVWVGITVAAMSTVESVFLVVRHRIGRRAEPGAAADRGNGAGLPGS